MMIRFIQESRSSNMFMVMKQVQRQTRKTSHSSQSEFGWMKVASIRCNPGITKQILSKKGRQEVKLRKQSLDYSPDPYISIADLEINIPTKQLRLEVKLKAWAQMELLGLWAEVVGGDRMRVVRAVKAIKCTSGPQHKFPQSSQNVLRRENNSAACCDATATPSLPLRNNLSRTITLGFNSKDTGGLHSEAASKCSPELSVQELGLRVSTQFQILSTWGACLGAHSGISV